MEMDNLQFRINDGVDNRASGDAVGKESLLHWRRWSFYVPSPGGHSPLFWHERILLVFTIAWKRKRFQGKAKKEGAVRGVRAVPSVVFFQSVLPQAEDGDTGLCGDRLEHVG